MLPLQNLRVVELGGGISASYCTKMMADLGAEVIKIEDYDRPDSVRSRPPLVTTDEGERLSGSFLYLNTSKKSVALDLDTIDGRSIAKGLILRSDLVVESLPFEDLERLGLSDVLGAAPAGSSEGLVAMSISDFGRTGPYKTFTGTEIVIDAMSGWMYGLGDADREPRRSPGSHGLIMTGIYGFIAALAALYQVQATGRGQYVDVSALESVLWAQLNITTTYEYSGSVWRRHGDRSPMSHPQGVYECKDGLIGVNVLYYAEWDRFPEFIGRPELLEDPRFTTPLDRANNAAELDAIINPWLMSYTRLELYKMAQENKLPFALVNSPRDLVDSEQLKAREFWVSVPHPSLGAVVMPSSPFKMGEDRWGPRWAAPSLGQDNDDVLGEILSPAQGSKGGI